MLSFYYSSMKIRRHHSSLLSAYHQLTARMRPTTPTSPPTSRGKGRHRGTRGRISTVQVARARSPLATSSTTTNTESDAFAEAYEINDGGAVPSSSKLKDFTRAAQSIISWQKLQMSSPALENKPLSPVRPQKHTDPWAAVMSTVVHKVTRQTGGGDVGLGVASSGGGATSEKRVSLAQMLKSREMKNLVKQALVAKQVGRSMSVPEEQSQVMAHWIKLSTLRRQQPGPDDDSTVKGDNIDGNLDDDDDGDVLDDVSGVRSGFDLDDSSKSRQMYGRTLILEESCRRAFALDSEQRSQMDLQALSAWFQMTKLKITTDFERLQPSELDLLCRRMTLVTFHPDETIFRQGDEGDALYILFSGIVEVRVSQRILGEVVEVTVCELAKGDYFGERSLLHNDVRAATVLAKTAAELVKITRNDYNLMLKNDQLEFLSRMQIANGIGVQRPAQRSQREYIKVLSKKKHTRTKADIDMLSEYLQTLKFFRSLPKSFVRELCVVVDFLTLPSGACVFREGEVGDQFYIIFSGSVDVNISSNDFRGNIQQTKLVNLTEGSHFGELALMKGRGVRSATVVTREESQLLVICENDYNSTLRRMQKKDMAKRVGVLDQIPMFQTPEWTGELLKELSYVLLEQKLSTGTVLYRQGDRASHVYFVVRGELVVTKEIVDPLSQTKHEVFVERIGRYRVVGDDAAAGASFNEAIHRQVTVSASTPVEVLLLSKYDVFHRLSRSARESLRAAAQSHAETVVYVDRFHKTQKWEAYKQKMLRDHVNHDRIEKILPSASAATRNTACKRSNTPANVSQARQAVAAKRELKPDTSAPPLGSNKMDENATLPLLVSLASSGDKPSGSFRSSGKVLDNAAKHALVPANELLLLAKEAQALKSCFNPDQTLGHYVTSFNADAPPTTARQHQLDGVLAAEQRRQAEILKEGNPLAFFGVSIVEKQTGPSWNRTSKSLEESEEYESDGPDSIVRPTETTGSSQLQPSTMARNPSRSLKISSQDLSQLLQENFIFSRPVESKPQDHDVRKLRLVQLKTNLKDTARLSQSPPRAHLPSRASGERIQPENASERDYVLFSIRNDIDERDSDADTTLKKSPAFQILQSVRSLRAARDAVTRVQVDASAPNSKFFILPLKTFALMPSTERSKADEERRQVQQINDNSTSNQKTKILSKMSVGGSTSSLQSLNGDVSFASFHEVVVPRATRTSNDDEKQPSIPGSIIDETEKLPSSPSRMTEQPVIASPWKQSFNVAAGNGSSAALCTFAVASVVLSKLELAHLQYEEPFLSVHALFSSEVEAVTFAMNMDPSHSLKSAMLCVFPVGRWLRFEDAHNWCVKVEANKREKRTTSCSSSAHTSTESSPVSRPGDLDSPQSAWEQEREEAKRLHQFICARMGAPMLDKKKDRTEESGGFTPRPLLSLEDKLDTLHDYLQSTTAVTTRPGGVAIMKYRQVKRFGSIMRSRIAGAVPSSSNSPSTFSPRTSFSTVVPG